MLLPLANARQKALAYCVALYMEHVADVRPVYAV